MNPLLAKLKYVGSVHIVGYSAAMILKKFYQDGKIKLTESEWANFFKKNNPELYKLDLTKDDIWSTYDKCISIWLKTKGAKVSAEVKIYDGENMNGTREHPRLTATFSPIPLYVLKKYSSYINNAFETAMERLYNEEEENKKKQRIKELGEEILAL